MKKIITLLMVMLSVTAWSEIPLEDFFKPSEFTNMVISPDGSKVAAVMEGDTRDVLSILDMKNMESLSNFDFGPERRIGNLEWSGNDYVAMNVQKTVGFLDRKGRFEGLYVAKYNGKMREFLYGRADGLTFGSLRDSLKNDPDNILVNLPGSGVKKHNIKSGRSMKINTPPAHGTNSLAGVFLDKNHKTRGAVEFNDDQELFFYYLPDDDGGWQRLDLGTQPYAVSVTPAGYSEDPNVIYVFSNHEKPVNGLYSFNLNTGKMKFIYRHPLVDLEGTISDQDDNLIGLVVNPDYRQTVWIKPKHPEAQLLQSLQASFPNQDVSITSTSKDGTQNIIFVRADTNPGQFYMYDTNKNELKFLAASRPWLKNEQLSEMKPVSMKARDGVELHGYLTLPKGKDPKNLPLIVNPHGGPHGPRDRWSFVREIQYLANRGYAVLQINFRGSGGYGQAFMESGYQKWGREMQDDVTDATLWAVEQGYADKERLCIYGGSYGGYAALQGVVREPDLYKCAVGYVGVYDMTKFMTCGDGAGQTGRTNVLTRYIGDDGDIHRKYSPAYNVDKIKADLFIAHGKDDVRVPMCQGNSLKKSLEKAGKEFIWMARDEGHGYQKLENQRDFYTTMVSFFEKNIGK
ncbi:alpha/beta hydrolase family protein [Marinicella sp. W31]|uniref:alpha/beta hydrolase family protein n=1 Tax=Marinicella sp. W31 TaxID=3023713 RepID=UPI0037575E49